MRTIRVTQPRPEQALNDDRKADRTRGLLPTLAVLAATCVAGTVWGQTSVRATSATGQVFIMWQVDATSPLTYDIDRSGSPIISISQSLLAGGPFRPEWRGDRLKLAGNSATRRVPAAGGGTHRLAANDGRFAFTPRTGRHEHRSPVSDAMRRTLKRSDPARNLA